MTRFVHTVSQDTDNPGWYVDFVYDAVGMAYIKDIHAANTDMRFLSKMDQDYYYDWMKGTSLDSGSTFPTTKQWGDRFEKTNGGSVLYWWDGTAWIKFDYTYYLMLDYFPTKSTYLYEGARVYRTDEDKEYRYNGSSWLEITATSGDAKKRIQSKAAMTTITAADERSCFHCREIDSADPINDAYTKFWAVLPTGASFPDHIDLQIFFGQYRSTQRYQVYEVAGWEIDYAEFTLQSQETVKPIADIVGAMMTIVGDVSAYYDVTNYADGLYYRKFVIHFYKGDPLNPTDEYWWTDEDYGIAGRTTCVEWNPHEMCAAYSYLRYVDGATGSDSNDGTSWANAWATIGHAASTVTAGTLVTVKAGTYVLTSTISTSNSGTLGRPIHYWADGTVIIQSNMTDCSALLQINNKYIIIEGFDFDNNGKDCVAVVNLYSNSGHCVICNNHIHNAYACSTPTYCTGLHLVWSDGTNMVVGNTIDDIRTVGDPSRGACITIGDSPNNICFYNGLIVDPANCTTVQAAVAVYTSEGVNDVGNFYSDATINDSDNDCIGSTNYTKGSYWVDSKPIVLRGATFHKAPTMNILRAHLQNSGLLSYLFAQNLRQIGLVNVPPTESGGTPNSFVESWCPDTKTRRLAYAKPGSGGASIGGCDIRGCGQILEGCPLARIKTVNSTATYNDVARILDKNENGDVIISGTGIIDLTDE